jgi:energy-coupling factor transporter ATP-binding protein EcfA2
MKLVAFTVEGYRRFVSKTSIKVHGDLIAIVGPNEAGKTSLLRAMSLLHDDQPFTHEQLPRRRPGVSPRLHWHFQLEPDDRAQLAGVFNAEKLSRVVITKAGASRDWHFEPPLLRDRSERIQSARLAEAFLADNETIPFPGEAGDVLEPDQIDVVLALLRSDTEDFDENQIGLVQDLALHVRRARLVPDEVDDATGEPASEAIENWTSRRDAAFRALTTTANRESEPPPRVTAIGALGHRLPDIKLFDEADRDLASAYDLNVIADHPPRALAHLAGLAGLDLVELRDLAAAGRRADVHTRSKHANEALASAFEASWNQQDITVQVDVNGSELLIQTVAPADGGFAEISERSDGMRWFAALLAYSHGWKDRPILLVDEVERHLHYDAQADLIDVLAVQNFASKVIYTTHSFGCLPHDLGTGVRAVRQVDHATSEIENGFWNVRSIDGRNRTGAGFSPLMVSMGAAAATFTPTRRALIAEGQSDALLLPTLLRQATGATRLGFQIAPGLASLAAALAPELQHEAGRVGYLVDGDHAGKNKIRGMLLDAGVDRNHIIALVDASGMGLEVEDLIDPEVYVVAAVDEIRCWQTIEDQDRLTQADIPSHMRSKAVEVWCAQHGLAKPDKIPVAERVLAMAADKDVFDPNRRALLDGLLTDIQRILGIESATDVV